MAPSEATTTLGLDERERLLRGSYIFRNLAPELARRLAQLCHIRTLPEGAVLFQQGDEGDALYAVVSGLIRIAIAGEGGKELTLGLMEPGDVFGEIALLDGLTRTAGAQAAENSVLLVVQRAHFLQMLEAEPGLARHIIELLCERLRINTDRITEYAFLNLHARLARKIESLAIAHGQHGDDGVRIALQLSQSELAQMLGVTREAVNKQLKTWSQAGVLRVERGAITVCDMRALAAAGRGESI
ncbi:MAG TPA: Crp/Fnr family transcriptional regulator [Alphaproteobacteria bacterium]|jgi:CRP-like cAMP-binding protein|nr:Crp/Fnr family transcriptional regulator [Alphaproteobacteria bacterium]